jgi:hypothetical protein
MRKLQPEMVSAILVGSRESALRAGRPRKRSGIGVQVAVSLENWFVMVRKNRKALCREDH